MNTQGKQADGVTPVTPNLPHQTPQEKLVPSPGIS